MVQHIESEGEDIAAATVIKAQKTREEIIDVITESKIIKLVFSQIYGVKYAPCAGTAPFKSVTLALRLFRGLRRGDKPDMLT